MSEPSVISWEKREARMATDDENIRNTADDGRAHQRKIFAWLEKNLKVGDVLPSYEAVGAATGMSKNDVGPALQRLEVEGTVSKVERRKRTYLGNSSGAGDRRTEVS